MIITSIKTFNDYIIYSLEEWVNFRKMVNKKGGRCFLTRLKPCVSTTQIL